MAVITANSDNFEAEVLNSDKPVIVDFNAAWCGPCKMLGPVIEELSDEREDIKFVSVDIDEEDILAEDHDVSSIPCLVAFKDGKEIGRSIGIVPKSEITALVEG
ncbi:MAG: thioredoxin [Ruminococcus sp.]|nr:thioredoxin [Ruminococcus sp.]